MEATEINIEQRNFAVEQQTAIKEDKKNKLPKFELPDGERLYISREELTELNDKYFQAISDLNRGGKFAPAELRAVMESVVCIAYGEEIEELRRKNCLDKEIEYQRIEALTDILLPWQKRKFFRWKRNHSQMLLDELVRRQAAEYLQKMSDSLPVVETDEESDERELLPFEVVIGTLKITLPRMRKKRRAEVTGLIEQLYDVYNGKADECKRLASELEIARRVKEEAEDKARAAAEMLEEFLKDSTPAPEETANAEEKAEEEPKTPEEAERTEAEPETEDGEEPEEEQTEEEADSEPADEDEEESLSYDGLEGMDERE